MLIFGVILYLVDPCSTENGECHFTDIFQAAYYVVVTVCMVGYGDIVPTRDNLIARALGIAIMSIGPLFLAMPLSIIGHEFDKAWQAHVVHQRTKESGSKIFANHPMGRLQKRGVVSITQYEILIEKYLASDTNERPVAMILVKWDRCEELYQELVHRIVDLRTQARVFDQRWLSPAKEETIEEEDVSNVAWLEFIQEFQATQNRGVACQRRLMTTLGRVMVLNAKVSDLAFSDELITPGEVLRQKVGAWKAARKVFSMNKITRVAASRSNVDVEHNQEHTELELYIKRYGLTDLTVDEVLRSKTSNDLVEKLWLFFTIPILSPFSRAFHMMLKLSLIGSILLVLCETMPAFQHHGESSEMCQTQVERYCHEVVYPETSGRGLDTDPGCFVVDLNEADSQMLSSTPLTFHCSSGGEQVVLNNNETQTSSPCFGYGWNFGSDRKGAISCYSDEEGDTTPPFAKDGGSSSSSSRNNDDPICSQIVCHKIGTHNRWFLADWSHHWIAWEWYFALLFSFEQVAKWISAKDKQKFWHDPIVWVELVSILPFYGLEIDRFIASAPTTVYAIAPGSTDIRTAFQLLKITRIYKLFRWLPQTHVVSDALIHSAKRLVIPYCCLFISSLILSFFIYVSERGVECQYGHPCNVYGTMLDLSLASDAAQSLSLGSSRSPRVNERVLINLALKRSNFEDVYQCFWFIITAISSVGYGDATPISFTGRGFATLAMVFGAFYTAMPLVMVGGQFYAYYVLQKKREVLVPLRQAVRRGILLNQNQSMVWKKIQHAFDEQFFTNLGIVIDPEMVSAFTRLDRLDQRAWIEHLLEEISVFQRHMLSMTVLLNRIRKEAFNAAFEQQDALDSI